jgi:hypothetical protein
MTTAAMVTYAYDQIDQARTELNAASEQTIYESLETSSQSSHSWHGDMTDIVDKQ